MTGDAPSLQQPKNCLAWIGAANTVWFANKELGVGKCSRRLGTHPLSVMSHRAHSHRSVDLKIHTSPEEVSNLGMFANTST